MHECRPVSVGFLSPFAATTLFVGNLSFNVRDHDLSKFFADEGFTPASARVITQRGERERERSKG